MPQRSASPSKFESQATSSPSKLSVPNRKQRNQPANRVHDIEFATEISTSLLSQVRNLQALLAEKEEALKAVSYEKSRLEAEAEGFSQRLRSLDESEQRYKDENWNLETQIHEYIASTKEAADREKKLTQALNALQAEKTSAQRELDEIKLSHAKLTDDHAAAIKHHDVELGGVKRNMALAENERGTLQRKVEDLTGQNQELAKFVAHQRGRLEDRDQARGLSDEDFETAQDNATPEHSPPPSPVKGTPRHSMLESETLKSSLHHSHRMIQNLKGQVHREKTEKLELKRMLQDARDELESRRNDGGMGSAMKRSSRKKDSIEFKKPFKPNHLGGLRNSKSETFIDDTNWEEDNGQGSPSTAARLARSAAAATDSSDHFDTANEGADEGTDDFETANERATETEDFQTGVEDISGSDELTETEGAGTGTGTLRNKKPPPLALTQPGNRNSWQSTASTSGEEYTYEDLKTPTASANQPQRLRLKVSRGQNRRRFQSEEPQLQSSPASFVNSSKEGTPQPGQSLFAELGDMSDEESYQGTPSRSGFSSQASTPASRSNSRPSTAKGTPAPTTFVPPVPKLPMVSSGMMTEPWKPESEPATPKTAVPFLGGVAVTGAALMEGAHLLNGNHSVSKSVSMSDAGSQWQDDQANDDLLKAGSGKSRPLSTSSDMSSQYDPEHMEEKLAKFPSPPTSRAETPMKSLAGLNTSTLVLGMSSIESQHFEPESPVLPPAPAKAPLSMSSIASEYTVPQSPVLPKTPVKTAAPLTISSMAYEHTIPQSPVLPATPKPIVAVPAPLSISPIAFEQTVPQSPILPATPKQVAPIAAPLAMSTIASEHTVPQSPVLPATPKQVVSVAAPLAISAIAYEHTIPQSPVLPSTPKQIALTPAPLSMSSIAYEHTVPLSPVMPETPKQVEPVTPILAPLTMSSISYEHTVPESPVLPPSPKVLAAPPTPMLLPLVISSISSIHTEPIEAPPQRSPRRDAVMIPRDAEQHSGAEAPQTPPKSTLIGSMFGLRKKDPSTPVIAEDDTRQSLSDSPATQTPDSQRPFKELSGNGTERSPKKARVETIDESSQTALTAEQIDGILNSQRAGDATTPAAWSPPRGLAAIPAALKIKKSQESISSVTRSKGKMPESEAGFFDNAPKRPGSAGSGRKSSMTSNHPPLPTDHKQVIAAAAQRSGSSNGASGSMGPPLFPASASRANPSFRPRTPSNQAPLTVIRSGTTPRAMQSAAYSGDLQSPTGTGRSRHSSVSSFTSEVETRFNLRPGLTPGGFGPGTDPRMINAITQTMIGEYLWKYTRKAGREAFSENRHRRYFWVHPYTRTLYWGDHDPSQSGRAQQNAKSVPIEAVRVVTDDNPMPPGLHRKSLVIITPGRSVKFTAQTGQRHETWFNALSYLLLRTGDDGVDDVAELASGALTREDVEEFNPQFGARPRAGPASLSSYNSRTTRNDSPARTKARISMQAPPTLATTARPSMGTLSRLSNYFGSVNGKESRVESFSSRRSRHSITGPGSIYEASEVHDSAEDLREMLEQQERESDRLENVRACCDGKHTPPPRPLFYLISSR